MTTIARLAHDAEHRSGDRITAWVPRALSTAGSGFVPVKASATAARRRAVSAALLGRGIQKGDKVAVVADTRLEWMIADLAITSIGAVTIGVYPSSTPEQMRFMMTHAGCRAVFVGGVGPRAAVARALDGVAGIDFIVDLDDDTSAGSLPLTALIGEGAARLATDATLLDAARQAVRPEDAAAIVYTSGTTGDPKGVVLTHGALFQASRVGIDALGVRADDVGVGFLPLAHALARVNAYGTLHAGNTIWFSRSLEEVADVWRDAHPTVLALVPRVLEKIRARVLAAVAQSPSRRQKLFGRALEVGTQRARLIDDGKPVPRALAVEHALWERLIYRRVRAGLGWDRLRFALCGGAPLRREVAEFFAALGVAVLEGYGLSETSAATVLNLPGANKMGCVGRALPNVELRLEHDGEILIRCPGLFAGYHADPHATAAALTPDGFFRTGDVGAFDGSGRLVITDRKKDLIVTAGGKNVAPQNIEATLLGDEGVTQAVVLGDGRPYLVALLALDPAVADRAAAATAAVARANASLARFEQIKRWALLDEELTIDSGLLTPTQKVKRRAVAERFSTLIEGLYAERSGAPLG